MRALIQPAQPALTTLLSTPPGFTRYVVRHRRPVVNWTCGAITLLGDAAHPMVHYLAQGAAMALEDAICLGEAVGQANGNYRQAFADYQARRLARASRVQISALMLHEVLHADGVQRLARNAIFESRSGEEHRERFAWLYTAPDYVRPPSHGSATPKETGPATGDPVGHGASEPARLNG